MTTNYLVKLTVLALMASPVFAQEPSSAILTWKAPTAYSDGTALEALAPLTYVIERRIAGVWTQVGVTNFLTYTETGLLAGEHCYRVLATLAGERSDPSVTRCKTIAGAGARRPRQPTALVVQ